MGYTAVPAATPSSPLRSSVRCWVDAGGDVHMENHALSVTVDKTTGWIRSLVHRATNRDIAQHDTETPLLGQLMLYEDIPLFWDAWDLEAHYGQKSFPSAIHLTSLGIDARGMPLRARIVCRYRIDAHLGDEEDKGDVIDDRTGSVVEQIIELDVASPYLAFHMSCDWHENRKVLRAEFPVDVYASEATYETQYGMARRPTHFNTSWDAAKFEVCGHRWMDLSEHGFGVSIFNDCKYGHSVHGKVMGLTLLRAPKAPDKDCDMGHHTFSYAIYPHEDQDLQSAGVIPLAAAFNSPITAHLVQSSSLSSASFFTSSNAAVVLQVVKCAEDDPKALILRYYEAFGGRAHTRIAWHGALHFGSLPVTAVVQCTVLEQPIATSDAQSLKWVNDALEIRGIQPWAVGTLKLVL